MTLTEMIQSASFVPEVTYCTANTGNDDSIQD